MKGRANAGMVSKWFKGLVDEVSTFGRDGLVDIHDGTPTL